MGRFMKISEYTFNRIDGEAKSNIEAISCNKACYAIV